ncbi:hypothetical protein LB572_04905 [Mesorhizobium sp. BH1-1-5]|nr:hypothetical protein [Mesorhizobium sp. BH1-1-5]
MSDLLRRTLAHAVEIETVLAGGLWKTHADPSQVENAIINLAVNARDAMDEKGKLTIETANSYLDEAYAAAHPEVKAGQYAMIAVTDTGAGMSPDIMAQAFEPFFTTKPAAKGTARAQPGVRLRQAIRRSRQNLFGAPRRHDDQDLSSPFSRFGRSGAADKGGRQERCPGNQNRPARGGRRPRACFDGRHAAGTRLHGHRGRQR